jgi:hypothetical protein
MGWRAYGEQMMFDALIKVPERRMEWDPRTEPVSWEKQAVQRIKEKLEKKTVKKKKKAKK